ncbi:hypothetical protein VMT65_28455 [Nocardia sp. CDC153]|uniref:hypothetical protein n=1 Tax=Nocardia sp. CDC153 TaxID=3112167 RepID=UPI002DB718F1|nr:hypothetical protein [Nocardia sp. CDC153]MEC3957000.1 hypothetical protein [Nocardia sp. CDC153]
MRKHLITVATIALLAGTVAACGDHRSAPLTPPSPTSSVPFLGGGQIPEVIDVPTSTPATTSATKTR